MQEVRTSGFPGERRPAPESNLEAALSYARRGWRVIPIHTPVRGGCSCGGEGCAIGKHPRNLGGVRAGSLNETTIRAWWTRWPDANIGICAGLSSGLCVLDVDGGAGEASLRALGGSRWLPDTLVALSGRTETDGTRSGLHHYFRHSAGVTIPNSIGRLGAGLDVRGAGGYVVAPPSLHVSGLRYEWRDNGAALAEVPDWLVPLLAKPPSVNPSLSHWGALREGVRNDRLFRSACAQRRKGADEAAIVRHLVQQNNIRCPNPLPEDELARIAASAVKYPIGGLDPLEAAWAKVLPERPESLEAQLLALATHLQAMRPGLAIALPQVRVGKLLGCDPTLISRYKKRLIRDGRIVLVAKHIAKRMAALYRVA